MFAAKPIKQLSDKALARHESLFLELKAPNDIVTEGNTHPSLLLLFHDININKDGI